MLAVEAVVDIAYHGGGVPVQAKEIASRQGVPPRFLEPVMQELVHAGVLRGVRGPRGGYKLAKALSHISLGEIIRIVSTMGGADDDEETASELRDKVVAPIWQAMLEDFHEKLDSVTVAHLCGEAQTRGVDRNGMWRGEAKERRSTG